MATGGRNPLSPFTTDAWRLAAARNCGFFGGRKQSPSLCGDQSPVERCRGNCKGADRREAAPRLVERRPPHNQPIGNEEMKMTDQSIENEIQQKGLTAPRITPADVDANITSEFYFTASDGVYGQSGFRPSGVRAGTALELLTFCVLVMRNGFTVTGESACASPENFDAEIGRKIARQNAVAKIWPLMGYALRSELAAMNYRASKDLPSTGV